jgi:hypothetical protein
MVCESAVLQDGKQQNMPSVHTDLARHSLTQHQQPNLSTTNTKPHVFPNSHSPHKVTAIAATWKSRRREQKLTTLDPCAPM